MYANRIPFTRDGNNGPQNVGIPTKAKKAAKQSEVIEPAKIEEVDLITEPAVVAEEAVVEVVEEATDGND
jgi:hypothetical protein